MSAGARYYGEFQVCVISTYMIEYTKWDIYNIWRVYGILSVLRIGWTLFRFFLPCGLARQHLSTMKLEDRERPKSWVGNGMPFFTGQSNCVGWFI